MHRETAISFFNGYGTEINTFAPGRPDWMEEEFKYLHQELLKLGFRNKTLEELIEEAIDYAEKMKNPKRYLPGIRSKTKSPIESRRITLCLIQGFSF